MGDSNYTAYMKNSLQELRECDKEAEYSDIIDFLNTDFRSFGDGLKEFLGVRKEDGKGKIRKYLESSCKKRGMEISDIASRNTLNDWFEKGVRPKKGKKARNKMYECGSDIRQQSMS